MRVLIVNDPEMVKAPLIESPGFAKKGLSDYHLDLLRRCHAQCTYCSTGATTPMRVHRERLNRLAIAQHGIHADPTRQAGWSISWDADEFMRRLDAQLHGKARGWLDGKTVMLSQLTDAFIGPVLTSGLTRLACDAVLAKTTARIRVLTKSDAVGRAAWIDYFKAHPGRFVVGLSIGTLDDAWAARVEPGTSKPSARVRALQRLQDAGVPTFGMLCPVFPDVLDGDHLDRLLDAIRPERCETIWDEPFNDRDNWRAVRDGYAPDSYGWQWLTAVYESGERYRWSTYATMLYQAVKRRAHRDGWADRRRYLLYEDGIHAAHAPAFAGFDGVLLQSAPVKEGKLAGYSANQHIAALQRSPEDGRIVPRKGKRHGATSAPLLPGMG